MKKNDFPGSEDIVETVREPLLVLDANLNILSANRSFYNIFKVEQGETIGHLIFDVGNKQWDIPALRKLLEEILPTHKRFDNYEVVHDFPAIGHKTMLLNARQVYRKDVGTQMILLAIESYETRDRVHGHDLDDWFVAEKIVMEKHERHAKETGQEIEIGKKEEKGFSKTVNKRGHGYRVSNV